MDDLDIKTDVGRFSETILRVDWVYDAYAKAIGLNGTGLALLHLVYTNRVCTQSFLAAEMWLPKQTVHSVVKLYEKQGLVELVPLPGDSRQRGVRLTQKGQDFAELHIPRIYQAETESLAQFSLEDREMLTSLMGRYAKSLEQALLHQNITACEPGGGKEI